MPTGSRNKSWTELDGDTLVNNITNLKQDPTVTDTPMVYKVELLMTDIELEMFLEDQTLGYNDGYQTYRQIACWYPVST